MLAAVDATKPKPKPVARKKAAPKKGLPEAGPSLLATDQDLHYLRRFTFGVQPGLVSELKRNGRHAWFEKQLNPSRIADPLLPGLLAQVPDAARTPAQLEAEHPDFDMTEPIRQLKVAILARQLYSQRQLLERMVGLWQDRLHVCSTIDYANTVPARDAMLRTFALGKFSDLLRASTRDAAMLIYLNADHSAGDNPNENLGRELLELHTVGTGNYTETDVRNSALVLTGLTVGADRTGSYTASNHYVGPVQVMGWSSPNASDTGGTTVIDDYLDYLAHHPATAAHVSRMIAQRFVADTPSAAIVTAMAAAYSKSDTSIAAVLRAMVAHKDFAASVAQKSQGPADAMLASVRSLQCVPVAAAGYPDQLTPLLYELQNVNAAPTEFPTPDGPPDDAQEVSASTVLQRWNLNAGLTTGTFPGLRSPVVGLLGSVNAKAQAGVVVDRAASVLLHQKLASVHRNQLLGFVGKREHYPIGDLGHVPGLLSMLLNGPYSAVR